jgi:L-ascorbate metabolism protein UlaG (beta-lactamase superfamily)
MHISWYGFNYFKLQNSNRSLIFNPYSLDKVKKFSKCKAEIILFSDPKQVARSKFNNDAFVIDSAGEFEVSDIFVYGRKIAGNIVYLIIFDDIKIAFLGEFGHQEMSNGDLELIEGVDVLILPVGGGDLTTSKEASKIISQVDPMIVIPSCHADGSGKLNLDAVSTFIKEFGVKPEETEKFNLKKKDLFEEEVRLVVLKAK